MSVEAIKNDLLSTMYRHLTFMVCTPSRMGSFAYLQNDISVISCITLGD